MSQEIKLTENICKFTIMLCSRTVLKHTNECNNVNSRMRNQTRCLPGDEKALNKRPLEYVVNSRVFIIGYKVGHDITPFN